MTLLIRADASTRIGTGHVMRCLALAQAWQSGGGHAFFAMSMESPALQARLQSEGIEVIYLPAQSGSADDAVQTVDLAQRMGATWVVADGYHFGAEYQRIIKGAGQRLLFIDDNGHADHYCADVVLNQNIHAHEGLYENREPYTRLLLGPRYVLLRREFLGWRRWKREIPEVARKVLVTLGGGDPDNVTLKVIQALQQVKVNGLEAVVVVGGSNPHYEELQSAAQDSRFPTHLKSNVVNMPELMAWADVAVSAGGSTCWELAFMELPSLLLPLAENQRMAVSMLSEIGVSFSSEETVCVDFQRIALMVTTLMKDAGTRLAMSQKGSQLIDGFGVTRILKLLNINIR